MLKAPSTLGTNTLQSYYSTEVVINKLISGTIVAEGNHISGLRDPKTPIEGATKNYVNNIFKISKNIEIINQNQNLLLTPEQIINGTIQRILDTDRTDKFPTGLSIIPLLTRNYTECIIMNMSDTYTLTIDLFQEGINVIASDTTFVSIEPKSLAVFRLIVANTGTSVDVYFSKNNTQTIYFNEGLLKFDEINTTNKLNVSTVVSEINGNTNLSSHQVLNGLITIITSGTLTFPSRTTIMGYLGITTFENFWTFQTIIRNTTGDVITFDAFGTSGISIPANKSITLVFQFEPSDIFANIISLGDF